ncbi:hypothetical protein L218DRAFT_377287 [Marasmius fiardii PR-910]|nr:hypothetical protein L218DRAFT_377287 [Marasmius fiardii PR-910]
MPSSSNIPVKTEEAQNEHRDRLPGLVKKEEEIGEEYARRILQERPRNKDLKVKKKLQDLEVLPLTIAAALLKDIPNYEVEIEDPDIDTGLPVSREFLVDLYGGNSQRVFPSLSSDNMRKMTNDRFATHQWACMTSALNPYLPSLPGVSGLVFTTRDLEDDLSPVEYWKMGVCRVFSLLEPKKWLYVGHYEFEYGKTLTPDEWKNLPYEVRKDWIKQICGKNGRWRDKRIRIFLRNRPGKNRQFGAIEYLGLMASKEDRKATPEQVNEAFLRGEEAIVAWKMKCVDYEEGFQGKLSREFPNWTPPVRDKSGGRGKSRKVAGSEDESESESATRKPLSKSKGKKRMVISDDDDGDDQRPKKIVKSTSRTKPVDYDSDSEVEVFSYTSKGSKSRPHKSR